MKFSLISTTITSTLISNAITFPVNDATLSGWGKANDNISANGGAVPYYVWSSRPSWGRSGLNGEDNGEGIEPSDATISPYYVWPRHPRWSSYSGNSYPENQGRSENFQGLINPKQTDEDYQSDKENQDIKFSAKRYSSGNEVKQLHG